MAKPKVLVFLGTSRQGAAVVDALLASDKFEVYATTRSAKSAEALKARGVKCGPFTCGDAASAKAALDAAGIENDLHIYDDVNHGFWLRIDEEPDVRAAPGLDAWNRLKAYLNRTLGP